MNTMRVGSLFTGYGGLDIAVGGDLAWYAEIEPAACQVLAHHYPGVPNLGDITAINWAEVEPVDVITGGYPCQPFSHAGNRKGKNDVRHLWPNVLDAIRAIRPRYAILENVSGHITLGFADVLADLAEIGWDAEWGTFRASDVGAPHRRERIFIIAHTYSQGSQGHDIRSGEASARRHGHAEQGASAFVANAQHDGSHGGTLTGSISASKEQGRLQQFEGCDSSTTTNTSGDGHGEQLHARGMASVEGQTEGSSQQRQRTRRESDAGSVDDAADTDGSGTWLHGSVGGRGRQASRTHSTEVLRPNNGATGSDGSDAGSGDAADTDNGHGETVGGVSGLRRGHASRPDMPELSEIDWGKYGPAIARWESVLERNAPDPVVIRNDKRRLNPCFVEWMMGLPDGWVTGHGLSAAKELKMLGNGVVPQQAHAAITQLMQRVNT